MCNFNKKYIQILKSFEMQTVIVKFIGKNEGKNGKELFQFL